eukprot:GEMP01058129.1.p1 GENE.GEMP01058129.1~~GEMP01058129.1.p1  ORF type:complete len:194 (-),score=42.99 GEMP01058129.1:790-1371(-)
MFSFCGNACCGSETKPVETIYDVAEAEEEAQAQAQARAEAAPRTPAQPAQPSHNPQAQVISSRFVPSSPNAHRMDVGSPIRDIYSKKAMSFTQMAAMGGKASGSRAHADRLAKKMSPEQVGLLIDMASIVHGADSSLLSRMAGPIPDDQIPSTLEMRRIKNMLQDNPGQMMNAIHRYPFSNILPILHAFLMKR